MRAWACAYARACTRVNVCGCGRAGVPAAVRASLPPPLRQVPPPQFPPPQVPPPQVPPPPPQVLPPHLHRYYNMFYNTVVTQCVEYFGFWY